MFGMVALSVSFRVQSVENVSPATSPSPPGSIPGPHLFLDLPLAAILLGRPLVAAVEALREAVPVRSHTVLRMLLTGYYFPVGGFGRGAFGHRWATTAVEPQRQNVHVGTHGGCLPAVQSGDCIRAVHVYKYTLTHTQTHAPTT